MKYNLWYWSGIQGRGEFVRLPLEAAGIDYRDCAREAGDEAMLEDMKRYGCHAPYASPYLELDGLAIPQVANILQFLGERHGLAPSRMSDRLWVNQLQLTLADLVAEVHNVHHPVDVSAYYADQKSEAARAAAQFREVRLPKFLLHFEAAVTCHPGDWLIDHRWTYADCSLFQVVEGLRYMFPKRMATLELDCPGIVSIHDRVAELPGIAAYLKSERRLPFSENGIFRHYPELDAA